MTIQPSFGVRTGRRNLVVLEDQGESLRIFRIGPQGQPQANIGIVPWLRRTVDGRVEVDFDAAPANRIYKAPNGHIFIQLAHGLLVVVGSRTGSGRGAQEIRIQPGWIEANFPPGAGARRFLPTLVSRSNDTLVVARGGRSGLSYPVAPQTQPADQILPLLGTRIGRGYGTQIESEPQSDSLEIQAGVWHARSWPVEPQIQPSDQLLPALGMRIERGEGVEGWFEHPATPILAQAGIVSGQSWPADLASEEGSLRPELGMTAVRSWPVLVRRELVSWHSPRLRIKVSPMHRVRLGIDSLSRPGLKIGGLYRVRMKAEPVVRAKVLVRSP